MTSSSARVTVSAAGSIEEARRLLGQARRPNSSFTQRDLFDETRIDRALRLRFRRPEWVWFARESPGRHSLQANGLEASGLEASGLEASGLEVNRIDGDGQVATNRGTGSPNNPAPSNPAPGKHAHKDPALGVVAGWGSAEVDTPFVLDFLDLPMGRPDVAKAILDRAVADSAAPGQAPVEIVYFLPSESRMDDPPVAGLIDLLDAAGYRMLVRRHRYRLDVREHAITIPDTHLRFDSIELPDDPRLPAIMAEILVGSLDAHDRAGLARSDIETAAAETVAEYLQLDRFDSMFLALDADADAHVHADADADANDNDNDNAHGAIVGLVIGGLRGSAESGVASFVGVSNKYRGHGYAAQLLGWITKRMIGDGALFITAETDNDNLPMAAAFATVGYLENESRIDFVREVPSSAHVNAV